METETNQADEQEEVFVTPEEIMNEIAEGAASHSEATEAFIEKFSFYGKSLGQWADELVVPIPKDPTPQQLRDLYIKLGNNIQIASHFYSVATTVNSTLAGGGQMRKSDLVTKLVKQYEQSNGRRPARETLERMADSYMGQTVSTRIASKAVKEFWKQRIDTLKEVRKCLESISMSYAMEMKYLDNMEENH